MNALQEKTGKRIRRHVLIAMDALTRAADGTFCPDGTMQENIYVENQLGNAQAAIAMALQRMKDFKVACHSAQEEVFQER